MWQFAEAVRGLADGCQVLGTPVTGGNVSFYNQTGNAPILPTTVIGVLGVIDDVTRRITAGFRTDGALVFLLGDTRDELGGSEWANHVHGFLGGLPPRVDLGREQVLAQVVRAAAGENLVDSAHDLADGGLAIALTESCLRHGCGVRVELPQGAAPFVTLFSESAGRALVTVPRLGGERFTELCRARGLPVQRLGVTDLLGADLEVAGQFTVPLRALRAAWSATLPARFGR
jgi:phosphoribosylformylglycinamidine synthase